MGIVPSQSPLLSSSSPSPSRHFEEEARKMIYKKNREAQQEAEQLTALVD